MELLLLFVYLEVLGFTQWDTTSHLSEWLKLTAQETTDDGEDAEKGKPSCTVGVNANWCGHCGKQYGGSSKS